MTLLQAPVKKYSIHPLLSVLLLLGSGNVAAHDEYGQRPHRHDTQQFRINVDSGVRHSHPNQQLHQYRMDDGYQNRRQYDPREEFRSRDRYHADEDRYWDQRRSQPVDPYRSGGYHQEGGRNGYNNYDRRNSNPYHPGGGNNTYYNNNNSRREILNPYNRREDAGRYNNSPPAQQRYYPGSSQRLYERY